MKTPSPCFLVCPPLAQWHRDSEIAAEVVVVVLATFKVTLVVLGRVPPPTEEWLEADARLADSTSTAWDVRAHLSCPVPAC